MRWESPKLDPSGSFYQGGDDVSCFDIIAPPGDAHKDYYLLDIVEYAIVLSASKILRRREAVCVDLDVRTYSSRTSPKR